MILAALALSLQPAPPGAPLDPQTASQTFLSICVRHVADPEALRAAIRSSPLGFARARGEGQFEVYRAGRAEIGFEPGRGCAFKATMESRSAGAGAIHLVSEATGRQAVHQGVNRGGSGELYHWPDPSPGQPGLSGGLDWVRLGAPDNTPTRLSLWVYLRSAP